MESSIAETFEVWSTGATVLAVLCSSLVALPLQLLLHKRLGVLRHKLRYKLGITAHVLSMLALVAVYLKIKQVAGCTGCFSGVFFLFGIPVWWTLSILGVVLMATAYEAPRAKA